MTLSDGTLHHIRLGSGLVMLTYVVMHMANHMLGIVSLSLAEAGLSWALWLWHSTVGTALLYGAFTAHLALALRTLYVRQHWRLPATEWFRLWAGFSLPLLLIGHVVGTRVATSFYGFQPDYEKVVSGIINGSGKGWQLALLAPGWVHGCLGLWIGMRTHPVAQRAKPVLIAILVAVPLLSAAGFVRMTIAVEAQTDVVTRHVLAMRPDSPALASWGQGLLIGYLSLITASFVAGRLRPHRGR
jgi:adenylate cyclase